MIDDHLKEWFGQKVEEYKPGAGYGLSIPRFGYSYDNEDGSPAEDLTTYLADPRTATIKGLVFGMPAIRLPSPPCRFFPGSPRFRSVRRSRRRHRFPRDGTARRSPTT